MFVFSLSSGSAAQMPLAFVLRQYALCLLVQRAVDMIKALGDIFMFRRDELERFRPSPNPQANAGKYPHSHPYPLRFSG